METKAVVLVQALEPANCLIEVIDRGRVRVRKRPTSWLRSYRRHCIREVLHTARGGPPVPDVPLAVHARSGLVDTGVGHLDFTRCPGVGHLVDVPVDGRLPDPGDA